MFRVHVPQVEDSLADVVGEMHARELDESSIARPGYTLLPAFRTPEGIGPFCFQGGAGRDMPIKQRRNIHLKIIYIQPATRMLGVIAEQRYPVAYEEITCVNHLEGLPQGVVRGAIQTIG